MNFSFEKLFIVYLSIELLRFYIDTLRIYSIEQYIQGFRGLEFPAILKALEIYLNASSFLRSMILYYIQIVDLLQRHKTTILVEGQ